MKKILIINFGTKNDLIKSANYIQNLKDRHAGSQISVLTDTSKKNFLNLINGIYESYFLDSKDISTTLNNPLYSDLFALNTIEENLSTVLGINWDIVINYDHSLLSCILTAAITRDKTFGNTLTPEQTITSCSPWSAYQKFTNEHFSNSLINNDEINSHIVGMPNQYHENSLKVDSDFLNIAKRNFNKILLGNEQKTNFVGIQLSKDIKTLKDIFSYFIYKTSSIPVFIHQSKSEELKVLNQLNADFNNKIISISADTSALTAVIQNLTFYITDKSVNATIADLLNISVIECLENFSVINKLNNFSGKHFFVEYNSENIITTYKQNDSSLLKTYSKKDVFGSYLLNANMPMKEIAFLELSRLTDLSLLGYKVELKHYQDIHRRFDQNILKPLALELKEELGESIKKLLGALRSVRTAAHSKESMLSFLKNLDSLFFEKTKFKISSSAIALFEHKMEKLDTQSSFDENLRKIEILLFELKNNFQHISSNIDSLTGVIIHSEITL